MKRVYSSDNFQPTAHVKEKVAGKGAKEGRTVGQPQSRSERRKKRIYQKRTETTNLSQRILKKTTQKSKFRGEKKGERGVIEKYVLKNRNESRGTRVVKNAEIPGLNRRSNGCTTNNRKQKDAVMSRTGGENRTKGDDEVNGITMWGNLEKNASKKKRRALQSRFGPSTK